MGPDLITSRPWAKPPALTPAQIRTIADTYAKSQVDNGSAIGVQVDITRGNKPPHARSGIWSAGSALISALW